MTLQQDSSETGAAGERREPRGFAGLKAAVLEALAQVLATHNIECTGLGEVTCRGCRDKGWMSWTDYRLHLADAILALLNGSTS